MKEIKRILALVLILGIVFAIKVQVKAEDQVVRAKVVVVYGTEEVKENEETKNIQKVSVKILEGNYEEEEYDAKYYINSYSNYKLKKGTEVYAKINQSDEEISDVTIEGIVRQNYIIYFTIATLALIILVFKKNGIKIILSVLLSILIIKFLIIDQIALGNNAIIISIIATLLIVLFNSIVGNGINRKSLIVIFSSIIGVLVASIIMRIFTNISILENNIINTLNLTANESINYNSLIIASTIIASMGVSLDISNTIVNRLKNIELVEMKKEIKENYIEIFNKYNSIIFICTGIFLTYIVTINKQVSLLNNELIALISLIIISILLSSVILIPITILLYKFLNKDEKIYNTQSKNIINGQRTLKL